MDGDLTPATKVGDHRRAHAEKMLAKSSGNGYILLDRLNRDSMSMKVCIGETMEPLYKVPGGSPPSSVSGSVTKKRRWGEDIAIILAIFTLWPRILGWPGIHFRLLELVALGAMVVVFVRRIRRIRQAR